MGSPEAHDDESLPLTDAARARAGPEALSPPVSKRPVLSATAQEWRSWMVEQGEPAYRARQVLDWIIRRRSTAFASMTDLPRSLRQRLDAEWTVLSTRVAHHDVAPDGTDKLVLECCDGGRIECVLMAEGLRRTVCVSTQVGCGM